MISNRYIIKEIYNKYNVILTYKKYILDNKPNVKIQ